MVTMHARHRTDARPPRGAARPPPTPKGTSVARAGHDGDALCTRFAGSRRRMRRPLGAASATAPAHQASAGTRKAYPSLAGPRRGRPAIELAAGAPMAHPSLAGPRRGRPAIELAAGAPMAHPSLAGPRRRCPAIELAAGTPMAHPSLVLATPGTPCRQACRRHADGTSVARGATTVTPAHRASAGTSVAPPDHDSDALPAALRRHAEGISVARPKPRRRRLTPSPRRRPISAPLKWVSGHRPLRSVGRVAASRRRRAPDG